MWTQKDLAAAMKLQPDTSHFDESIISRIESGKRKVSTNELRCLAVALDCSVIELIGDS